MQYKDFIKKLQRYFNAAGENLTVDGDPGPKTRAVMEKFEIDFTLLRMVAANHPKDDYFGAPWVGANIDLLGRKETDPELNERYVPEWKLEGLNYKTLSGGDHAWCSLRENADKRKVGVSTTDSAAASSWSKYGRKSPYWFGATLDIKHRSGGRHVCNFLYWIDEENKICATLDGNRGDLFCIAKTDLSMLKDQVVNGPRWPNEITDGKEVSMAEVLAKYPHLKVGSVADKTT